MTPEKYFNKKILGKIQLKEIKCFDHLNNEIYFKRDEFDFIDENETFFVCNKWYKEHKKECLFIAKMFVEEIIRY